MKDKFNKIILILIVIALFGIFSTLFIKKIEIKHIEKKYLSLDEANITDREKGICADMYKEGFNWGYGQFCLQRNIAEGIGENKEQIKSELYSMADNPCYEVK